MQCDPVAGEIGSASIAERQPGLNESSVRLPLFGGKRREMDLSVFYQKIRRVKESIATPHVVAVSLETPDGGREGVLTEVARDLAATLIVEGRARLATESEATGFLERRVDALRAAIEREAQQRVQLTVLSEHDLEVLRSQSKRSKS
jgi:hypothetical protein